VLKRGRIATDTEFYLVAGILSDGGSQASAEERAILERFYAAYEAGPDKSRGRTLSE